MKKKSNIWTGLNVNKKTGEAISFFIWKDGKKLEFTPDEARENFPVLMCEHERHIMLYNIYNS